MQLTCSPYVVSLLASRRRTGSNSPMTAVHCWSQMLAMLFLCGHWQQY